MSEVAIKSEPSPNVVALGYKGADGVIVVTDVLTANLPPMTKEQIAELSWKLDVFFKTAVRRPTPDPSP